MHVLDLHWGSYMYSVTRAVEVAPVHTCIHVHVCLCIVCDMIIHMYIDAADDCHVQTCMHDNDECNITCVGLVWCTLESSHSPPLPLPSTHQAYFKHGSSQAKRNGRDVGTEPHSFGTIGW